MTNPTQAELADALRTDGKAELTLGPNLPVKIARTRLIGAARFAGVRVSCSRDMGKGTFVATVLLPEEAEQQAQRAALYRAVNHLRGARDVLAYELGDTPSIDGVDIPDMILDIEDMVAELDPEKASEE